MTTLMQCGDVAHGTTEAGEPVCLVHAGTSRDVEAHTAAPEPDLTGRKSKCIYCDRVLNSDGTADDGTPMYRGSLPFLSLNPDHDGVEKFDNHYDGCRGWD